MPPMHEYQCGNKKCNTIFDELAGFDDFVPCPKCGRSTFKRISTTYHPVFIHRGKFKKRK